MNEYVEVIGVEHLKTVLSSLSPEDIVKPAYDNWQAGIKTGHTILNLETGSVYGLGIDFNQLFAMVEQGIIGELVSVESVDGDHVSIMVE